LARYARSVATSAGPVRLTYFHNLVWDGRALRERPKPAPRRDFGDFAAYRGFLEASLAGLAQNLSSSGRAVPLRMLGTISSGYDSPAVTVLAQPYGLQEAIARSEEHTSELQSRFDLVCRLLLEKKKQRTF